MQELSGAGSAAKSSFNIWLTINLKESRLRHPFEVEKVMTEASMQSAIDESLAASLYPFSDILLRRAQSITPFDVSICLAKWRN